MKCSIYFTKLGDIQTAVFSKWESHQLPPAREQHIGPAPTADKPKIFLVDRRCSMQELKKKKKKKKKLIQGHPGRSVVEVSASGPVMILGSWDQVPHWAPCSAGSLLLLLPLPLLATLPTCAVK